MSDDLFGTTTNTGDEVESATLKALREMKLGGKRDGLPEGNGVYEYEKLANTRSDRTNAERLSIRLKCVEHDKPECVGQTYTKHLYYQATGKQTHSMVMSDFTKYILYPFGAGAKQAAEAKAIPLLKALASAHETKCAQIVQTQAFNGKPYAGARIKINVVKKAIKRINHKTQQVEDAFAYNDFPDVA